MHDSRDKGNAPLDQNESRTSGYACIQNASGHSKCQYRSACKMREAEKRDACQSEGTSRQLGGEELTRLKPSEIQDRREGV